MGWCLGRAAQLATVEWGPCVSARCYSRMFTGKFAVCGGCMMLDPVARSALAEYKLIDFAEFLVGALTTVAAILTIIQFFRGDARPIIAIAFAAVAGASAVFFLKVLKLRAVTLNRLRVFSENYHKFTDAIRDEFHAIGRARRQGRLSDEDILLRARGVAQKASDLLANALTVSTGHEVCVCVKYFPSDSLSHAADVPVEEAYIMTLARSYNSSPLRTLDAKARVGENTGFLLLIRDQAAVFHSSNLVRFGEASRRAGLGPFRNSNPNWQDLYVSTISVPIRMKSAIFDPTIPDTSYDILGLLCADSMSTSAFPDDHVQSYVNILKAFAAALYVYLDRVYFYLRENRIAPS
jgi:hypothetical protein